MKIFTNDTAKALRDLFSVQWNIANKWWTQAQTNSRYAMLRSFLSELLQLPQCKHRKEAFGAKQLKICFFSD